ncbi:MAG: hypothetical protein HYV96_10260 [Opitutae bacterium]|nr:hypothetical protein [Opitutae bacterium]
MESLFQVQPFVALDAFLLPAVAVGFHMDFHVKSPVEKLEPETLHEWARREPSVRYPLLGESLHLFAAKRDEKNHESEELSPLYVAMLDQAPDKVAFFGDLWHRVHPRSWSGSLADVLAKRKTQMMKFADHPDAKVRDLMNEIMPELDRWIERERARDRTSEESFE